MRILYVTDALAVWGGIERVLSDKLNYLVLQYGYDIHIVTVDQGNHPIPFPLDRRIIVKDLDIRLHQQYSFHGIKRIQKYRELEKLFRKRLASYIEEINPDIISCIRDGYNCAILDVKGSIPAIFESHAMYRDVQFENTTLLHRFSTYWKRRQFKKLDRIVCLTQGDADDWKRVCDKVCVIPNIVHLNESGRYSLCNSKNAIFAGRFDVQKDFGTLMKVWSIVQRRHPDWVLNVYGNGELKPYYEKEVNERNLNIVIHPAVEDIFEKFLDSSMLLMTSLYEPFGLVLAEAMSCGLPVIAFDCPYGPSDIIHDGIDGYLIEDRDIESYSKMVCRLIEDEQLRRKMGQAGVVSSQRYNADTIMPQWDSLFKSLVVNN